MTEQSEKVSHIQKNELEQQIDIENVSLKHKISKFILGTQNLFISQSLSYLTENKNRVEHLKHKQIIEKCQTDMKHVMIGSIALSGAFILSLRRYFPSAFVNLSLGQIFVDVLIVTGCLTGGIIYGSTNVMTDLYKLQKSLLKQNNQNFLQWMKNFRQKFGVSVKHQLHLISEGNKKQCDSLIQEVQKIDQKMRKHFLSQKLTE